MRTICTVLAVALSLSAPVFGADALERPNWDATLAAQTANLPQQNTQLEALFGLVRSGNIDALENRLEAVITGGSLSGPVRDAVLFNFTVGLADFDRVDGAIIDRLRSVKPRVLVAHEERAEAGVPMYNIAGAAEGVYQLQVRRSAQGKAQSTVEGPPAAWVKAYLDAGRSERGGYIDALDAAPRSALANILSASLETLPSNPGVTPVAGKSALLLGDVSGLEEVVRHGSGPGLASILEAAGLTLAPGDALNLLEYALSEAPPVNASLAIAQLCGPLRKSPEAHELLFGRLDHAELGAAAALALADHGDDNVTARLEQIAMQTTGLAPARARMALRLQAGAE